LARASAAIASPTCASEVGIEGSAARAGYRKGSGETRADAHAAWTVDHVKAGDAEAPVVGRAVQVLEFGAGDPVHLPDLLRQRHALEQIGNTCFDRQGRIAIARVRWR
jgi:hypothetical protein